MYPTGVSSVMDLFLRGRLADADRAMGQAVERLSTGKRINRASDDVSGFLVADNLRVNKKVMEESIKSADRFSHFLAAKEGAMGVLSDLAIELQGIVVQAANRGALGEGELESLQLQADGVLEGIDFIANTTHFNGEKLLDGFDAAKLGLRKLVSQPEGEEGDEDEGVDDDEENAPRWFFDLINGDLGEIQKAVDSAAGRINHTRAAIGTQMQANESNIRMWMNELEGTSAELSRIEDADFAAEISKLVRAQILKDTSMRGLMIHRAQAGSVLGLVGA